MPACVLMYVYNQVPITLQMDIPENMKIILQLVFYSIGRGVTCQLGDTLTSVTVSAMTLPVNWVTLTYRSA